MLDAALQLARAGLKPVFLHSREKRPVLAAWQKVATCDEIQIRDQFARLRTLVPNLGIALGMGEHGYLGAVDVDDPERLAALEAELGPLPVTLSGRSPRGQRLFFVFPSDLDVSRLRNVTGLLGEPGVDVKVAGGQVVVGPSIHPELDVHGREQRYSWDYPLQPIAELPAEWAQAMMPPPEVPAWTRAYTPQSMREDRAARQRAERYLERAVIAEGRYVATAREGTRNSTFHKALCRLLPLAHGCMVASGPGYVVRELSSAARGAGLSELEITRTVASVEKWVAQTGAVRHMPEPQERPATPVAPVVDIVTRVERPAVVVVEGGSEGSVNFIKDPRTRQPAALPENVARMLEQDPAWLGGPRWDRYAMFVLWPTLPRALEVYSRLDAEIVSADYGAIQAHAMAVHDVSWSHETIERGVRMAAMRNSIDSLIEWHDALPAWDGIERLGAWMVRYLGCKDTLYHRVVGRAWLEAMSVRAYHPGSILDVVPILQGPQKAGKNRAVDILFAGGRRCAPHVSTLGRWDPSSADTKRMAASRWCLHDDEHSSRDPKQLDAMKSWVSQQMEQWVPKYSNDVLVAPRRAGLICSTNQDIYLYDATGNRRYFGVRVDRIVHDELERDRLQLWAEAKLNTDWRRGLAEVAAEHEEIAQAAMAEDGLEDILRALRRTGAWDRPMTGAELAALVGVAPEKQDRSWVTRLGVAVGRVAGHVVRRRVDGAEKIRLYYPTPSHE